jgi:hypothetical protein
MIALSRKKDKGKVRIRTQVVEQEKARRARAAASEASEKSGRRENFAMVCDGQGAITLKGPDAARRDASSSQSEGERGGGFTSQENNRHIDKKMTRRLIRFLRAASIAGFWIVNQERATDVTRPRVYLRESGHGLRQL